MEERSFLPWWVRHQRLVLAVVVGLLVTLVGAWFFVDNQTARASKTAESDDKTKGAEETSSKATGLEAFWQSTEGFEPLDEPTAGDWRSRFKEPRQSYEGWVNRDRKQPSDQRGVLYLQPIGDFDEAATPDLEILAEFGRRYFQMPVKVRPPIDAKGLDITRRQNPHSGQTQWLTGDLLDLLEERLPDDAYGVLGLTVTDLWPGEGWNFVFGQARLSRRVGVYSLARYGAGARRELNDYERRLTLLRSMKVMTHELGHMFGISHCLHYRCNMNGSNSLDETDAQPIHLCPVDLRKLHTAAGFDPVIRYEELADFYEKRGFEEQADFARRRAAAGEASQ
ncbi:MAG: archaemetzincin [Persicimonas sp.]